MPKTPTQLIRIGHSPDPDDAFMFYALAHEKIDMRGFKVEHVIEDIESLNQRALGTGSFSEGKGARPSSPKNGSGTILETQNGARPQSLEVTAVSCHAYAYLADRYAVMRSGASVGDNYGPILVTRAKGQGSGATNKARTKEGVLKVAIPGELTTAYLVFQLYQKTALCPVSRAPCPVFVPFDRIFDAVKTGEADLGLIIHEGQITYGQHGLELAVDLGKWWHETTQLPLPLGVDVIRKDLGPETMKRFAGLFKESIEYALNHRKEALEYASQFGRGIADDLNDRFVGMYVNDYTVELGEKGEAGFRKLLDEAYQHKIIPHKINLEFI
jgi:1,4-dihydroxy-6-naphthoate synthase